MNDELVERVARALHSFWATSATVCDESPLLWEDAPEALRGHMRAYAQAALAALKPGDVWEDWRITKNADVNAAILKVLSAFSGLGDEMKKLDSLEPVARQAAEEMRELARLVCADGSIEGEKYASAIAALEVE